MTRPHELPAGPRMPAALQTVGWTARAVPFLLRAQERHGDVFSIKIAPTEPWWVVLGHPDAVKEVFTGSPDDLRAGEGNAVLEPILGSNSVLLLDGPRHLAQRRLLLPPFKGSRMEAYEDLVRRLAREEVASWARTGRFPVAPRMAALTLEVILRAVFGVREGARLDALRAALRELLEVTTDPRTFLLLVALPPAVRDRVLGSFGRTMARVDELLGEEIDARRREADLAGREDVLSMLLLARHEDGTEMTFAELRDELLTLLVAGHETTATALSWALERLGRAPAAWERLQDREPEYVEAVCTETLRLRPVLPVVVRKLTRDMTIAGHTLPAGVKVVPCIVLVHRRADLYPDPHAFVPERWLGVTPGTYTWIPFGGGVRRCLGASFALMEMRVVLDELVASGRLRPATGPSEPVRRRAITMAPARGGELAVV